jgi:hypothetical protein
MAQYYPQNTINKKIASPIGRNKKKARDMKRAWVIIKPGFGDSDWLGCSQSIV